MLGINENSFTGHAPDAIDVTPRREPNKRPQVQEIKLPLGPTGTQHSPSSGFPRSCAAEVRERKPHRSIASRCHSAQVLLQACPQAALHACPIKKSACNRKERRFFDYLLSR